MTDFNPSPAWSEAARATWDRVQEESGPLDAATATALREVCALISRADALGALVGEHGYTIQGSAGQTAIHPAVPEERHARREALTALRALGLASGQSGASRAGAALASKRWNKNRGHRLASVSTLPAEDRRAAIQRRLSADDRG